MGRSYLGCREKISTGQMIFLLFIYREMFSRLPGKVSRGDIDFVKCKQRLSASEISVPGKIFRLI